MSKVKDISTDRVAPWIRELFLRGTHGSERAAFPHSAPQNIVRFRQELTGDE